MARFATGNDDDALDIVQEAMLKLVQAYSARPESEWPALFYRILQNKIRDWQRRSIVRDRVFAWLPSQRGRDGELREDPIQTAPAKVDLQPHEQLVVDETAATLERAIAALPRRQQQTFLLRSFEGLDVASTAKVMGCSPGSVKTHYSRALHALRAQLGDDWNS